MTLNLDRSGWQKMRVGDFAENVNDRVDDPKTAGVSRYVGLEHLDPGCLTVNRWGTPDQVEATKLRFKPGDVIFGRRRAYQKKVARADFAGICSAHAMVLRAKPAVVDPEFLAVFLSSDYFLERAIKISVGSLSPTVNWKALAVQEFELPPLDQQRRIADLLWAVEHSSIRVGALAIALADVTDTFFQSALDALPGSMVPTESLLIEGPRNGLSLPANDGDSGFPTVTLSAIREGEFIAQGNIKMVEVERQAIEPFLVREGDFMVVRGNGNRGLVAKGGVVRSESVPKDCFYPDLLIRLRFNEEKVLFDFAATQWNSRRSHAALLKVAKTTNGTYKINGKDVRNHEMKVPSLPDQVTLLQGLDHIRRARVEVEGELAQLNALRASILSRALWANP